MQADLATHDGVEKLWQAIQATGRAIDAIAINAGVGVGGKFAETDLQKELNLIQLNVTSTVHLAKYVVRDMLSRGSGRILFTSSIAGTMPRRSKPCTARPRLLFFCFPNRCITN